MELEINTDKLKSDAGRMREQLGRVKSAMNSMNSGIGSLGGMWKGAAKDTFTAQYTSDYDNMMEVCAIVEKMISGMNDAADKYNRCDSEVRGIINSINV